MILVDTDVLVDINRGRAESCSLLDQLRNTDVLATSVVTRMELIVGCRDKRELEIIDELMGRLLVVPINEQTSNRAAELLQRFRLSHGLLIPDALIAATAMQLDCKLLTRNRKHFAAVPGLEKVATT